MAQKYQFCKSRKCHWQVLVAKASCRELTFQPTANPSAGSTNLAANCGIAPGRGSQVVISPRACIIIQMKTPVMVYPRKIDKGPARVKADPIPKKRPVPMVPPSAINWMWRDLSLQREISVPLTLSHVLSQHTYARVTPVVGTRS